jgi:hypothetical protein
MTLATWPMLGPMNESTEPQEKFTVLPAGPTSAGAFELQPEVPSWPPRVVVLGELIGQVEALAPETGATTANTPVVAAAVKSRLPMDLMLLLLNSVERSDRAAVARPHAPRGGDGERLFDGTDEDRLPACPG